MKPTPPSSSIFVTPSGERFLKPRAPNKEVEERKARFAALNATISEGGGWVTSIPGDTTVRFETLPDSVLPARLMALGYEVVPDDPPNGERILAGTVVEKFTLTSSGIFERMVEGSTKAVASIRTHAGIVRVERFSFRMP